MQVDVQAASSYLQCPFVLTHTIRLLTKDADQGFEKAQMSSNVSKPGKPRYTIVNKLIGNNVFSRTLSRHSHPIKSDLDNFVVSYPDRERERHSLKFPPISWILCSRNRAHLLP